MLAIRAAALALLSVACTTPASALPKALQDDHPMDGDGAEIDVAGLSCPQCASNVDLQLLRVPGVAKVEVDLGLGQIDVTFANGPHPSRRALAQAVVDSGFTVLMIDAK
jgi:copper chaperone CopZ